MTTMLLYLLIITYLEGIISLNFNTVYYYYLIMAKVIDVD